MNSGNKLALFVCAVLFATNASIREVQAGQGFFFAPYFAPWPGQYYRPAWRQYHSPPRKRKAIRSAQRNLTHSRKRQRVALAVPRSAMRKQSAGSESGKHLQQAVDCEKAQAIASEFGFKEIKAEFCEG